MRISHRKLPLSEQWAMLQYRMIRETETFLEEGLKHPSSQLRIPALPVDRADFPRGYANLFWSQVLATS